jgi:hypothetical protein
MDFSVDQKNYMPFPVAIRLRWQSIQINAWKNSKMFPEYYSTENNNLNKFKKTNLK